MVRRALLCMFLLLLYGSGMRLYAQEMEILHPVDGSIDVGIRPTIIIKTGLRIDRSSVTWPKDSLNQPDTLPHTVRIIPQEWELELSSSHHNAVAARGKYEVSNDTLKFTPRSKLLFGTEYSLHVSNLRIIDDSTEGPSPDTLELDDTTITFTTVSDIYRLVTITPGGGGRVGCGDTVKAKFNRKLQSPATVGGDILTIRKLDSISSQDTGTPYYTSQISTTTWIDPTDSTLLYLTPNTPFNPATSYFVHADVGDLTGDPADDRKYPIAVREGYSIQITAADEDNAGVPRALLSDSGAVYVPYGSTRRISVREMAQGYAFLRWESPDDEQLDSSTQSTLNITRTCDKEDVLNLKAVFRRLDTVTVDVANVVGITTVEIVVYRFNDSTGTLDSVGGPGGYDLLPGEAMMIQARGGATVPTFSHWQSDIPGIDGVSGRFINVKNSGTMLEYRNHNVGAVLTPVLPEDYGLCAEVFWAPGYDDLETVLEPEDVLAIFPNPCITGNSSEIVDVTATVVHPCYEIGNVLASGPGVNIDLEWPLGSGPSSWTEALPTTKPYTYVYFTVRPKDKYKLTLETSIADRAVDGGSIGPNQDVRVKVEMVNTTTGRRKFVGYSALNDGTTHADPLMSSTQFEFLCGEKLELTAQYNFHADREEGFAFTKWEDISSAYTYPSPSTQNPFQYVVMNTDKLVGGIFNEGFRLRRIGFYRNDNKSTIQWFTPKALRRQSPDDIDIFHDPVTGHGTRVRFQFSRAVDQASVDDRLAFRDISERTDELPGKSYGTTSNLAWFNSNKEVEVKLRTGSIGIPKGVLFRADMRGGITSNGGTMPLRNPINFKGETEMPGVLVKIVSIKPMEGQGDVDVELFSIYKAVIKNATGGVVAESPNDGSARLPLTGCYDELAIGQTKFYEHVALTYPKMQKDWWVSVNLTSLDYDGNGCDEGENGNIDIPGNVSGPSAFAGSILGLIGVIALSQAIGVDLDSVWGLLILAVGALGGGWLGWLAPAAVAIIAVEISKLLSGGPDLIGTARWLFSWLPHFFGGKTTAVPEYVKYDAEDDPNIRWDVDFDLKIDD